MLPLLKRCADRQEHSTNYCRAELAADMGVSPEDLKERLPSGVQMKYDNRVYWALSFSIVHLEPNSPRGRGVNPILAAGVDAAS